MDIVSLLTEQLNSQSVLSKIGKSVGAKPAEVKKVAALGLPTLIKGLQANVSTASGADSLNKALDEHQDDAVGNIAGFLANVDVGDGAKILQHVLAGDNKKVQSNIAQQVGLKSSQVSGILAQLAPLLLGALGNKKKTDGLSTSGVSGVLDMLSGAVGVGGKSAKTSKTGKAAKDAGGGLADILSGVLGSGAGKSKTSKTSGSGDALSKVGGLLGGLISTATEKSAKTTAKKKTTAVKKKTK